MAEPQPPSAGKNIAETIAEEARRPIIKTIGDRPTVFVPSGYKREDLEYVLPTPTRKRGTVTFDDAASFIAYAKGHETEGTAIYCSANYTKGEVVFEAVLNDHGSLPGWRDHRALYPVPPAVEWARWLAHNKRDFTQAAFANFLEENMKDIATVDGHPTGSDMLAMALSLEVNQDARLRSSIRLQSGGVEMTFVDKEDDETLQRMRVFERFALGIPPFLNDTAYQLTARLRYRTKDGAVTFWYDLVRADLILQDATKALAARIATETGVTVYLGRPGAAS